MKIDAVVIGAGPAGLAFACRFAEKDKSVVLMEASPYVGGLARSISLWNSTVDLGPHRFFSSDPVVNKYWHSHIREDFEFVNRITRIYYKGKFYNYPLRAWNAFSNLGIIDSVVAFFSFLKGSIFKLKQDGSLETWVSSRFGKKLFEIFFKTYTEKVWGIDCKNIDADWASQRIQGLTLWKAIKGALKGNKGNKIKTLVDEFAYPKGGNSLFYERQTEQWLLGPHGCWGLHVDRAAGRDCDHRHPRVDASARAGQGQGQGQDSGLPQLVQAMGIGADALRRRLGRRIAARRDGRGGHLGSCGRDGKPGRPEWLVQPAPAIHGRQTPLELLGQRQLGDLQRERGEHAIPQRRGRQVLELRRCQTRHSPERQRPIWLLQPRDEHRLKKIGWIGRWRTELRVSGNAAAVAVFTTNAHGADVRHGVRSRDRSRERESSLQLSEPSESLAQLRSATRRTVRKHRVPRWPRLDGEHEQHPAAAGDSSPQPSACGARSGSRNHDRERSGDRRCGRRRRGRGG